MSLFDESTFDPVIGCAPVGQAVETAVSDGWGVATASFDLERRYRFRLSRVWDPKLGRCCFLMLNPSTADAFKVDPPGPLIVRVGPNPPCPACNDDGVLSTLDGDTIGPCPECAP